MSRLACALLLMMYGCNGSSASMVPPKPGTVVTDRGVVTGAQSGATWSWKGIPYAAPPVGDLRWKPTAPAANWSDERLATSFGPMCPQFSMGSAGDVGGPGTFVGNEDCLYLNVWAPASPSQPRAVMVFIHGGGNVVGSASQATYDGAYLAEHGDVVVVTFDYRLGPLGFMVHPTLEAESPQHASGNYALLDQIAALAWVQRNIAGFGGDPARVMLFGESAGAVDTCMLMASPLARGLFQRALLESGGCYAQPMAKEEPLGMTLAQNAGCGSASDASCLRALTPEEVLSSLPPVGNAVVSGTGGFQPTVDGWVLGESPIVALKDGSAAHVPFIVGSNAAETSRAVASLMPPVSDEAAYQARVRAQYPAFADRILAAYPSSAFATPAAAYVAVTTDQRFVCTARQAVRAAVTGLGQPVRRYFFTHPVENAGAALQRLGAFHGEELLFVFHSFASAAGYVPSAAELALSDAIIGDWARFAATGDPDGAWPAYDAASDPYLVLDDSIMAGAGLRTARCDFWDSLFPPP